MPRFARKYSRDLRDQRQLGVTKFRKLSIPEILVITSASVRPSVWTLRVVEVENNSPPLP